MRRWPTLLIFVSTAITTQKKKATKVIKKKKLVVPENFKDFNIRDFV